MLMNKEELLLQSKDDLVDTIIEYRKIVAKLEHRLNESKKEADELWHYKQSTIPYSFHNMGN